PGAVKCSVKARKLRGDAMATTVGASTAGYRPGYDPPPLPEIPPPAELALLLRVLARHGYDDLRAGHITSGQPDGTILINPRELCWPEVRASDVVAIDASGRKQAGRYNCT